jgi:hypothetical protein
VGKDESYGLGNTEFTYFVNYCRSPNDVVRNTGWEKLMYTAPLLRFHGYNENVLRLLKTALMILSCNIHVALGTIMVQVVELYARYTV